jgi:hypothetical protein
VSVSSWENDGKMSVSKKVDVGAMVQNYREQYPTAPRDLLRKTIRLELQHRKIAFDDATERRLDRALKESFMPEQQSLKKVSQKPSSAIPNKPTDYVLKKLQLAPRKFNSLQRKNMENSELTFQDLRSYAKTNFVDEYEALKPDFERTEKHLQESRDRLATGKEESVETAVQTIDHKIYGKWFQGHLTLCRSVAVEDLIAAFSALSSKKTVPVGRQSPEKMTQDQARL